SLYLPARSTTAPLRPAPWPGDTLQKGTTHDEATEGPAPRDARGHDGRGRGLGELGGSHSGSSERGEVCEVRRRRVERQQELARPGAAALEPELAQHERFLRPPHHRGRQLEGAAFSRNVVEEQRERHCLYVPASKRRRVRA